MSNILSKSPYIVSVGGASVIGGKVEIFLYKQGAGVPTLPQYTLSKLSPASNVNTVYFDVAPYVNEFITNKVCSINSSTLNLNTSIELYCNVRVKRYTLIGTTYALVDTVNYYGFKGYVEQKDSINSDYGDYLLDQKTYYYHYNSLYNSTSIPAGDLTIFNSYSGAYPPSYSIEYRYTNLKTGSVYANLITDLSPLSQWKTIYRVHPAYWADGNKLELYDVINSVVLATYYFKPLEECRYSPVTLDFINKYGAWQREFLFKNSTDSINTESKSYKNYRAIPTTFNAQESLVTTFNSNGNETIKCNTGFVEEDFKGTIKQLLLSDRILINNRPATITTNQIELQKNINNKLINYALDFTFSNPII
jgi:hypothetical protein